MDWPNTACATFKLSRLYRPVGRPKNCGPLSVRPTMASRAPVLLQGRQGAMAVAISGFIASQPQIHNCWLSPAAGTSQKMVVISMSDQVNRGCPDFIVKALRRTPATSPPDTLVRHDLFIEEMLYTQLNVPPVHPIKPTSHSDYLRLTPVRQKVIKGDPHQLLPWSLTKVTCAKR